MTATDDTAVPRRDPGHDNMFFAIAAGDVERTRAILENRTGRREQLRRSGEALPGAADQPVVGDWPLHFALMNCKTNLLGMVTLLMEFGANPNGTVLTSPGTPLALALTQGLGAGVVLALLRGGADVNGDAEKQQIPLHWCARAANLETCRFLLESGANWRIRDRQEETAEEVAELLHGAGAPITQLLRSVREAEELEAAQGSVGATPARAAADGGTEAGTGGSAGVPQDRPDGKHPHRIPSKPRKL